jgi:hypothetical protein
VFGASPGLGARRVAPVPAGLVALGKGWIDPRAADAEEFGEFGLGVVRRIVKLSLGGWIHDPTDPVGRHLFNVLGMVAECKADLIWLRTREGMQVAKAKGRLRGKLPKLKPNQAKHLLELHDLGTVAGIWQRAGEPVQFRHTKVSPARQAASASRRPGRSRFVPSGRGRRRCSRRRPRARAPRRAGW